MTTPKGHPSIDLEFAHLKHGEPLPEGFVLLDDALRQIDNASHMLDLQHIFGSRTISEYLWAYSHAPDGHLAKWQAQLRHQIMRNSFTAEDKTKVDALIEGNKAFVQITEGHGLREMRLPQAYEAGRRAQEEYLWWAGLRRERLQEIKQRELAKDVSRRVRGLTRYEALVEDIEELKMWSGEMVEVLRGVREKPVEGRKKKGKRKYFLASRPVSGKKEKHGSGVASSLFTVQNAKYQPIPGSGKHGGELPRRRWWSRMLDHVALGAPRMIAYI